MIKSIKPRLNIEPNITLGGSPISVPAPPIFERHISVITKGTGLNFNNLLKAMVRGARNTITLIESINPDKKAAIKGKNINIFIVLNSSFLAKSRAKKLKNPESSTIFTDINIPKRNPIVSQST